MSHGSAVLALTVLCWGLRWANPLWEAPVLSHRADRLHSALQSLSPEIQEWFLKKPNWVYAKPLASLRSQMEFSLVCPMLVPFCPSVPGDTTTARLKLPKLLWRRTHNTGKAVPNVIYALFYPLSAFCVFSLCQEFLKSVLWLWHWDRQVRQILHTHTHTHAPSKPDIRYLEINSVKRFGKVTVHAKTFKRHLGSRKKPQLISILFFFSFCLAVELVNSKQNGLFLFPVDQNEVICLPLTFWGADFHLNLSMDNHFTDGKMFC